MQCAGDEWSHRGVQMYSIRLYTLANQIFVWTYQDNGHWKKKLNIDYDGENMFLENYVLQRVKIIVWEKYFQNH